ncbi:hypothetical protein ABPG74_008221 [Tetrahymena malaccensis]
MSDFQLFKFDPNQSDQQILKFYQDISQLYFKNFKILKQEPGFKYKEDMTFLYNGNQTQVDLQKIKKELLSDFSTMCDSSSQIRSLQELKYVQCRSKSTHNLIARIVKNRSDKRFVIVHFYLEKSEKKQSNCLRNAKKEDNLLFNQNNFKLLEKKQLKEENNILNKTNLQDKLKTATQKLDQTPEQIQQKQKISIDDHQKTAPQTLDLLDENVQRNQMQDEQIRRSERIKIQKNIPHQISESDEEDAYNKKKFLSIDLITTSENPNYELSSDDSNDQFEENEDSDEDYIEPNQRAKKKNKSSSDEQQKNNKVQKTNQELSQFGNKQLVDQLPQSSYDISFENFIPPTPLLNQSGGIKQVKDSKKIIVNQKRNIQVLNNSNQNGLQQQQDINNLILQEECIVKKVKIENNSNDQQNLIEKSDRFYNQNLNNSILGLQNNSKSQEKNYESQLYDSIFNSFQTFYQEEIRLQNEKNWQVDSQKIQQKQKILNQIKNKLQDILIDLKQFNY